MSVGPILGYTANYNFTLVNYDAPRWHTYENNNWAALDAVISTLFGGGSKGVWTNATTYNVNDKVIDATTSTMYLCLVQHTTSVTGAFSDERAANPSYWSSLTYVPKNRGTWAPSTIYNQGDFVYYSNKFAVVVSTYTSSSSFATDVSNGYLTVLIDMTAYNPSLCLVKTNNLSDLSSVSTAQANLGLGSAATKAVTFFAQSANNLSDVNAVTARSNLGLLSAATFSDTAFAKTANNLNDLNNVATARNNLGLQALATKANIDTTYITDATSIGKSALTAANAAVFTALSNPFVGDTGSGGVAGHVPAPAAGDASQGKFLSANGTFQALGGRSPVRQTVVAGPVSSGLPAFLPANTTGLSLTTQNISVTTPLIIAAAQGFNSLGSNDATAVITNNQTWTGLQPNTTNYLFIDPRTGNLYSSVSAPVYQFGGTPSVLAGVFTFDYLLMQGFLGGGALAAASTLVCVGEAVTNASVVTSTVAYAYNGIYDSGFSGTIPTAASVASITHNLGIADAVFRLQLKNITTQGGYTAGQVIDGVLNWNGTYGHPITYLVGRNVASYTVGPSGFLLTNATSGTAFQAAAANWAPRYSIRRPWGGA